MMKTPDWTHVVCVRLIVVVLVPVVEVLVPRVVRVVLRRTPIVVRSKTTNTHYTRTS
jgi:hypothetical protein